MTPFGGTNGTTVVTRKGTRIYAGRHADARGRKLICSLLPGDLIMVRPNKRRAAEYITLQALYDIALESRVRSERMTKLNAKRKKG